MPQKLKKELLHLLSKMRISKKNLKLKNVNKISNKFIRGLKRKCEKKKTKKSIWKNKIYNQSIKRKMRKIK